MRAPGLLAVAFVVAGCLPDAPSSGGDAAGGGGAAQPGSSDGTPIAVGSDGSKAGPRDLRRLSVREYDNSVRDVFGLDEGFSANLAPDRSSPFGFDNDSSLLVVDAARAEDFAAAAERVAAVVMQKGFAPLPGCSAVGRPCAEAVVDAYGPRLFRRALGDADRTRYLGAYDAMVSAQASPSAALEWTLVAMTSSPSFLYRSELGAPAGDFQFDLTGEELATALAYDFSASPPSEELLGKGRRGELASPEARVAEARALLDTPRGHALVQDFSTRWLSYGDVKNLAKDAAVVPSFAAVRADMAEETRRFIDHVFFDTRGKVAALFTSSETWVTAALATHYGLPAPASPFAMVQRPTEQAIGLLAQGSILSRFALTDSTSPPQRGAFIRRRFLCQTLPPPPPNVGQPPTPQAGVTTRERYQQVTSAATCAGCHTKINDIGFALEGFDTAGRWRTTEQGKPIDASGQIVEFGSQADAKFANARELAQALAQSSDVAACVGGRMASYAFGSVHGAELASPAQTSSLVSGTSGLYDYFAQLAAAAHFARRAEHAP
ncbi:MAG: hypothetical protein JWN44_4602 [Myxococcales bacterium]|nr:hypothetical protein [Myxococcales bacterium]